MSIVNLTRTIRPTGTQLASESLNYMRTMPEIVLAKMERNGNKNVIYVGMNECKSAKILPDGVDTIYTDAIASCNAIGIIMKGKNGKPVALLSHYKPSANELQASAIAKELQIYEPLIDKAYMSKVFYNVPGYESNGDLKPCVNNVFGKVRQVLDKFFNRNYEEKVTLYKSQNRPPFFSSANIFQFDPQDSSKLKMTTVGEKEHFIDLNV
ncbi:MAG: hypothetical protein KIC80_05490 [Brachyspira sp.]|nr:hypothetical protein [Brachyspira sp.]